MANKKTVPLALLTTALVCAELASAQVSVHASGGNGSGGGGSVAYSVGQVAYTTPAGNSGSMAQGVQHAFEILTVGIEEPDAGIVLSVFPNPTTDNLMLYTGETFEESLYYELTDDAGRLILSEKMNAAQITIPMERMQAATYFIHVLNHEHKRVKSFKIIKSL